MDDESPMKKLGFIPRWTAITVEELSLALLDWSYTEMITIMIIYDGIYIYIYIYMDELLHSLER